MQTTNLFIPNKLRIGYNHRSDTYTKKLAYVIYYDNKGVIRKEKSFDSWRNKEIPIDEFDNVPTSGFVLNKKVGGYKSDWNFRQSYCRIYDPRGFEFEITFENLLYILQECNSIKGKGLEGEFIYSWCGTDLVLLPVSSPDYQSCLNYTKLQDSKLYAKDLEPGYIYVDSSQKKWIYIGKYQYRENINRNNYLKQETSKEKKYIFIPLERQYDVDLINKFYSFKGLTKFKEKISDTFVDNISDLIQFYIESPRNSDFDHYETEDITPILDKIANHEIYCRVVVDKNDTNFNKLYTINNSWGEPNTLRVHDIQGYYNSTEFKENIIDRFKLVIAVYKNGSKTELEY